MVRHYPKVHGGLCERCGVIDKNFDSNQQYKLCEHYRGKQLWCSYCPPAVDPDEVIRRATIMVMDSPDDASELVVLCDSYDCTKKHQDRFRKNA